ncbi:hypothetical protein [Kineothrix sp. MB12-C1]|uniref:hypothetical protein n=1 Tax=Kineothrix sp. MB12-C1 TaxID=3070215 RepID=UPI0027D262F2|nr:hypothetical protein [Kineothrix sp. MB12-C1]WMC92425.1 hypothetical protein RBB56_16530 [Kineothrix sp. MB12-C1]
MEQKLPGVYTAKRKDHSIYYRASITFRDKHISLGSYDIAQNAHLAYKEAQKLINTAALSIDDYTESSFLSFEKWVCLINFRDNRFYFSTPIYIKQKFFLYYLSPSYVLKFDVDDLFYYSSHKIMRRGGHLFVADYGMQVNILNRYGIKNYAVEGKDYRFINGDSTDFRYENIEILNHFHGITHVTSPDNRIKYKVRIHVKSNYVVGTYSTETEAAIAYNKAVDILKRNGIDRNYSLNYLEGLSPAAYADIYTKLKISPKIMELTSPNNQ